MEHRRFDARPAMRPLRGGATVPAGRLLAALVLAYTLLTLPHDACAQQAAINYVYDDLNRLVAAVDQQGNIAMYTYDLVGNLLRIDRVDAASLPDPVAITFVSPNKGAVAATVQIFGKGFSATAGQNAVAFNGTLATVTAATPNRLQTSVPAGATSGAITVTAPLGSATSPTAFRVIGPIAISPPGAVLLVNSTRQFSVLEIGNPGASFAWSVNGVSGGNATIGTVSPTGLYSAPGSVPLPAGVTLIATLTDDLTRSGAVQILIVTTPFTAYGAAPSVSVQVAPPTPPQAATPSAVPVSVMVSPASAPTPATSEAAPVAVTMEPVVTGVAPASAARGTANLALTLTGAGLAGATSLTFLRNNAADSTITIADLIVNEAGTQATATISIAAGAATGGRVVQISKPGGNSTVASTGANVLTVQ